MAPPTINLDGDAAPNRLFASNVMLGQVYYRNLDGKGQDDYLYGGYGIVSLTGGTGADFFIIGATPGGTGTTDYTTITDYSRAAGDRIVLSGGLTSADVVVRSVTADDLPFLNNLDDPYRIPAAVGDTVIINNATGQALAVVEDTVPGDIEFVPIADLLLTPGEQALLAPPTGGVIEVQNFAPFAPAFAPRIIEYADYGDLSAYYLSSGAYTTLAAAEDTFNKFVSFDFTDPPAPYGTYLNGRVGPLQHTHANELELFFVVSGTYIFTEGMQEGVNSGVLEDRVLTTGTLGYGPLGRVHGFRALPDDGPGRIYSLAIPAGLDKFFANAGTAVSNRFDQVKPNSQAEAANTAFWAGQRGDQIFLTPWDLGQINPATQDAWSTLRPDYTGPALDGRPVPTFAPQWPQMVTSSIDSPDRPVSVGAFGENIVSLVTSDEAKAVTGRVAWKGPFSLPSEPGASFSYDYLTLDAGVNGDYSKSATVQAAEQDPRDPTPSSFTIIYALEGPLSIRLYDQFDPFNPGVPIDVTFELAPLTYVQLPAGTQFSLANTGSQQAKALSIHIFNQSPPGKTELSTASVDDFSPNPDALVLSGDPTFAAVDFTLEARGNGAKIPLQIAVFTVNDQGQIFCDCSDHHGEPHFVSPGDEDFVEEALKHSKVIMSVLTKDADQALGSVSTLTNFAGSKQEFLVVQGSTVADALATLESDQPLPPNQVLIGDRAVSLSQNGDAVDIRFGNNGSRDVLLRATAKDVNSMVDPIQLGVFDWNYSEQHLGLLDLTYDINAKSLIGENIDVSLGGLYSKKSSLRYGFYQVQDEHGTIADPVTGDLIAATAENRSAYLTAATLIAKSTASGFLINRKESKNFSTELEGGFLYAPILLTGNGKNANAALVPFADLNPGGDVYNVISATNTWSWETDNSRMLYNDVRFTLQVESPFVQQAQDNMG